MAANTLVIELDDPNKIYRSGEKVTGQVVVRVQKSSNCKGLVLTSGWATHGRGNIANGEADSITVFSGDWLPDQEYRYPFELAVAAWPPTYYGHLLNISHQVQARAKLAWAIDPKATVEYQVVATQTPENLEPTNVKQAVSLGAIGWILGAILMVVLSVAAFFLVFLIPIIILVGGLVWLFTSYLPKSITGKVECSTAPPRIKPTETMRASMSFTPKRNSRINGIHCKITCQEVCVSGSGSNRQTHRHEILSQTEHFHESGSLTAGKQYDYQFDFKIPANAPPTLDLNCNDLKWQAEFRIDIPVWPDFSQRIDFIVESSGQPPSSPTNASRAIPLDSWLSEVLEQLQSSASDPTRLELVLAAIREHTFEMALTIEAVTDRPTQAASIAGGNWFEAFDVARDVTFYLHIDGAFEAPTLGSNWVGKTNIIGYVSDTDDVIITAVTS